jgi:hypothetical protein
VVESGSFTSWPRGANPLESEASQAGESDLIAQLIDAGCPKPSPKLGFFSGPGEEASVKSAQDGDGFRGSEGESAERSETPAARAGGSVTAPSRGERMPEDVRRLLASQMPAGWQIRDDAPKSSRAPKRPSRLPPL